MTEELKSCSFCGSNKVEVFTLHDRDGEDWYRVDCHDCHHHLREFHATPDDAVKAWNRMYS